VKQFVNLTVGGLRGLSSEQCIEFATPNGQTGSGLTVLVGSNNAGKSTFIEALRVLASRREASFSEGKRNKVFGDKVELQLLAEDGSFCRIRSIKSGGSETTVVEGSTRFSDLLVLPSRRAFTAYFNDPGQSLQRQSYASDYQVPPLKTAVMDHFAGRLFKVNRDPASREQFVKLLGRVVSPVPDWTIDQTDSGQYYLKFRWGHAVDGSHTHSSDGLGEGLVSLFFIIDSLYDSIPGSMTAIDEPELSLHPQFQRRLQSLLSELSTDRQIVYATQSPYFVSWLDIESGAKIARIFKSRDGTQVAQPNRTVLDAVTRLTRDLNNPHVLGIDASEAFFLEDNVILVEGQEDVVFYRKIFDELGMQLPASFFGWGVGGAEKMEAIARLLQSMGYRSVLGVLDGDKEAERARLEKVFPEYMFGCIPADDIRPKKERRILAKHGLVDENSRLRPEHVELTRALVEKADAYFQRDEEDKDFL
jgi:predicted ATP-dependent endonuclease of OLD family